MLQFKAFFAPHSYEFKDPDTGQFFKASSRAALVQRIIGYRSQNNLTPIERLDMVLENYLCSMPVHKGACKPAPPLSRGLVQYIKGGIALIQNLYYGDANIVTQAEADRRSAICAKCPHNVFPDKDTFIKWSDEIALHSVGERRSSHHSQLGNCEVCSCPLRAKVWYTGPFKLSHAEQETMEAVSVPPATASSQPQKCWQVDLKRC